MFKANSLAFFQVLIIKMTLLYWQNILQILSGIFYNMAYTCLFFFVNIIIINYFIKAINYGKRSYQLIDSYNLLKGMYQFDLFNSILIIVGVCVCVCVIIQ